MKKLNLKDPKIAKKIIEDAFLNIYIDPTTIFNPLRHIPDEMAETPHLYIIWLMQQPEYFSFICSEILKIEILPFQAVILKELWNRKLPMLIGSRGMSKSFMLSLYTMLRLLLLPQRKVVVVGAAFRQSKILFNYMNTIYNNSPILRDILNANSSDNGPHKDTDMYTFRVFDSIATMLPLGDGQKIRGQRANDIIADELDSINKDILEQVVFGFAAVSSNPILSVKNAASQQVANTLGIDLKFDDDKVFKSNQIITSGTAGYSFKHFCEYWKKWKKIIHTKGDRKKLLEIFEGQIPPGFNWTDYSIIRIPFEKLPRGFMDEGIVAQAKAAIHSGQYAMEYGACPVFNTLITTSKGIKPIQEIAINDLVLTHKGRFKKVTKILTRLYKGNIINYQTLGYNQEIKITDGHPYWQGASNFKPIDINFEKTYLTNLVELSNLQKIKCEEIVSKPLETLDGKRLYPQGNKCKLSLGDQRFIRLNDTYTQTELARLFNTTQTSINYHQTNKNIPKNSIPKEIVLDYNFGLIIGYYAAEGNIGSCGKNVEFALDEHKDTKFQEQLLDAINKVFGFQAKRYSKKKNCHVISLNSRLIADLIKYICPGDSYTKIVNHDILFSNPDFMKGFIEAYWTICNHAS
jgi:hypothetical protein